MFEPENDIERHLVRASADHAERPGSARAMLDAQVFVVLVPESGAAMPLDGSEISITSGNGIFITAAKGGFFQKLFR